jgi:hypothetical protein
MQIRTRSCVLLLAALMLFTRLVAAQSPGTFAYTGSLNTARYGHTATLLNNGMVLITGGSSAAVNTETSSAELYNPLTATFTLTGSMNAARAGHTATLLNNGMVLITGGANSAGILSSAELYNPSAGTFAFTGSLNIGREDHTATLLNNGMVLIAGGYGVTGYPPSAELYNPSSSSFTLTGSLNAVRVNHTATLLNTGLVLIAGGYTNDNYISSAELYNPSAGTFAFTGSLNTTRTQHTATLLNSGMVLIAGGAGGGDTGAFLSSAELYNPSTATFTYTGSMNSVHVDHTGTLLNDGMVLITGGKGGTGYLSIAELYNPSTGTFTLTGNLNTPRTYHTASLLNDGMVLIAAGVTNGFKNNILVSAELYQPTALTLRSISLSPSNQWVPIGNTQIFTATGTFSDNSTESLDSVLWTSSNTTVATVTNDSTNRGHAYALASGTTNIEACAGSVCGSTTMSVAPHTNLIIGSSAGAGAIYEGRDDEGNLLGQGVLSVSRSAHSATLLTNGTIFVAGGQDAPGSWQIFNINGQAISSGTLLNGFYSHLAVRLANGNVFLGGGTASPGAYEIHDPTGTLVTSGSLQGKRSPGAGAVLLQNGNVWISGSGAANRSDECSWEIRDVNGNEVGDGGVLTTCFASGKIFVLSNGDVLLIGGVNAPNTYEIHTQTGTFVSTGNIINGFDNSSGAAFLNNNVFLFESGFWEFVGFDANANVTFDTTGTLVDSRLGAKGVVTSAGNFFITGGSAAPGTWEMWTPSGTTVVPATPNPSGLLFDAHNAGHSDTHF